MLQNYKLGHNFEIFIKFGKGYSYSALHFDHLLFRYKQNSQSTF